MIPGTLPARALVKLDVGYFLSLSTSTFVIAPVIVSFFCLPSPVTTTSSTAFIFFFLHFNVDNFSISFHQNTYGFKTYIREN